MVTNRKMQMMDRSTNRRLQLATRIHYALLREIGFGIDVGRLLKHPLYARDVLLICDACEGHDLRRLAIAFRAASVLDPATGGASNPSGFGASQAWSSSLASLPPDSVPVE
ncbi:MAG TPA: hypothetical protein VFK10_00790 [Burkholderiaceae bacterium]|nr:hypothetical protein [Burkholderiaceae bacterium]